MQGIRIYKIWCFLDLFVILKHSKFDHFSELTLIFTIFNIDAEQKLFSLKEILVNEQ